MSLFEGMSIPLSKSVLDYLSARQRITSSNIANINTPGFKTQDVSFAHILKNKEKTIAVEMWRTHPRHLAATSETNGGYEIHDAYGPAHQFGGINDVDIDKEMLKLSEIQTNFNIFADS